MLDRLRQAADPTALTRQRFARRQWARRWLAWRVVVAAALLLVAVLVGAWVVFFSSVLAVGGVEVTGTSLLTQEEVRRAADVPTGEPLARADLASITERIEALAPVQSVDVSRQWPDSIRIEVTERVAVAVIAEDGALRGMDAEGKVFRTFRSAPQSLPRVRIAPDTREEALAEAASVVGVLPTPLLRTVDHVDVQTVDEITLVLRDGREVLWGSADESSVKADVLGALIDTNPGARAYDVSVPGQATVR